MHQRTIDFDGPALRDVALARVEDKSPDFVTLARRTLVLILLEQETASMDDVRARLQAPAGTDPRVFGSVPMKLARDGIIVQAGLRPTKNAKAHARPLMQWSLVNRTVARAWLQTNGK